MLDSIFKSYFASIDLLFFNNNIFQNRETLTNFNLPIQCLLIQTRLLFILNFEIGKILFENYQSLNIFFFLL